MDRICTRRGPQGRRCSRPGSGFPHYIPLYRETSQIDFLPELFDTAHAYASANSSYLSSRSIPITVTGVSVNEGHQTVSVAVTANLSALLPSVLNYRQKFTVIGYVKGRLDGR
jgi:hypothetical protein